MTRTSSPALAAFCAAAAVAVSCTRPAATSADCARATAAVRGRGLTSASEDAWAALPSCGAEGSAAARDAWASLRSLSDTTVIARTYARLRGFRDSAVLGAAQRVLLDSAATPEARVSSAMLVVAQLVPRAEPDFRAFGGTDAHDPCTLGAATAQIDGAALSSNAVGRASDAALQVLASPTAPASVRSAARCAYDALHRDESEGVATSLASNGTTHVSEATGRIESPPLRTADSTVARSGLAARARRRASIERARRVVEHDACAARVLSAASTTSRPILAGARVHEGILRRSPRGDALEMRDGRRLPVANLPHDLDGADGSWIWIAEPLGAPPSAGVAAPSPDSCPRQ